ncbi:unnamed protein product [Ambrosiozyma monospora]|uniref:Unnamed protein product n=1 Tax=Ambrosiozyma monospora TaxID=43982 RepID=A0A9W6YYF0_AMBMO|nr:unnamed protein product [Ambrosiozyma monospora]
MNFNLLNSQETKNIAARKEVEKDEKFIICDQFLCQTNLNVSNSKIIYVTGYREVAEYQYGSEIWFKRISKNPKKPKGLIQEDFDDSRPPQVTNYIYKELARCIAFPKYTETQTMMVCSENDVKHEFQNNLVL